MALDGNRWLHVPDGVPAIYDVDLYSVSPMGSWVEVRKRIPPTGRASEAVAHSVAIHPSSRLTRTRAVGFSPEVGSCYLRTADHMPSWLRERIAVLNIADAGVFVPGVGKRWGATLRDMSEMLIKADPTKRWYTVLHGCEEVPCEV